MCTLLIYRHQQNIWPLLLAANRDEMRDRPALPPDHHWPQYPDLFGGLDISGGGSWFVLNKNGDFAAILNRPHTLGPLPGYKSRGLLLLEILSGNTLPKALDKLRTIPASTYRSFHMVLGNADRVFWARYSQHNHDLQTSEVPTGYSMLTASDLNDSRDTRIAGFLPLFAKARLPDPASGDWQAWQGLLGMRTLPMDPAGETGQPSLENTAQPIFSTSSISDQQSAEENGLCFKKPNGFQTVSSLLLALPATKSKDTSPHFLYAHGPPCTAPYIPVI